MVAVMVAPLSLIPASVLVLIMYSGGDIYRSVLYTILVITIPALLSVYPTTLLYFVPLYIFMVSRFGRNEKSLIGFLLLASLGGAFLIYFSLLIVFHGYNTEIYNWLLYYYRVISIGASSIIALVFWFLTKTGLDQTATDDENLMLGAKYLSNPVMDILIIAVVITVFSAVLFINNKGDNGQEYAFLGKAPALLAVTINIDPKIIDANKININRTRIIKVAVLTDIEFDAPVQINPWTTLLDNDEVDNYSVHDVDKDGDSDLLLTFTAKNVGFTCDTNELTLTGETYDGVGIQGTDSVSITGCK